MPRPYSLRFVFLVLGLVGIASVPARAQDQQDEPLALARLLDQSQTLALAQTMGPSTPMMAPRPSVDAPKQPSWFLAVHAVTATMQMLDAHSTLSE